MHSNLTVSTSWLYCNLPHFFLYSVITTERLTFNWSSIQPAQMHLTRSSINKPHPSFFNVYCREPKMELTARTIYSSQWTKSYIPVLKFISTEAGLSPLKFTAKSVKLYSVSASSPLRFAVTSCPGEKGPGMDRT